VLSCALAESPALFGFVLVTLNGLYMDCHALVTLSLLQRLACFPRPGVWEDWVRAPGERP
jgi:hypothetical protein